jgi:hypothetical protein
MDFPEIRLVNSHIVHLKILILLSSVELTKELKSETRLGELRVVASSVVSSLQFVQYEQKGSQFISEELSSALNSYLKSKHLDYDFIKVMILHFEHLNVQPDAPANRVLPGDSLRSNGSNSR